MAKKVMIVHTINGEAYARFIQKEVNLLGRVCRVSNVLELGQKIRDFGWKSEETVIHFRTAGPIPNPVAKRFAERGFRVINKPEVLERTSDKFLSCEWADSKRIELPRTVKFEKEKVMDELGEKWQDKQFVLKPINSKSQGAYCFKTSLSDLELEQKIGSVPGRKIIIQEFVDYKRIYRVIVIGGKPIEKAVFMDEPEEGRWRVSVCLNPKARLVENPDPKLLEYGVMIANTFETEVGFIDVFETKNGEYVLSEINTACSLVLHERKSGVNISGAIAAYLVEQLG
jgi:glutathione synthase/RimK-type ligase-like ATP-grasp enzyme